MFLLLDVLCKRTKIPRFFSLGRAGVDFGSDGPSYSHFFGVIPRWGGRSNASKSEHLVAVEVDGIYGLDILQIQKGRRYIVVILFFPLAITFSEGPRGIFDFCMSSLLSACCWKMELEAVDSLHKKANAI